jgi:hypothetical protein
MVTATRKLKEIAPAAQINQTKKKVHTVAFICRL